MKQTYIFIPFLIVAFLMTNCIQDIISYKTINGSAKMEYSFKIIEKVMENGKLTEDEYKFLCEFISYLNHCKKMYEDKQNLIMYVKSRCNEE